MLPVLLALTLAGGPSIRASGPGKAFTFPTAATWPPAPPLPTAPSVAFYAGPIGGWGFGAAGPCTGQVLVDANGNALTYARSAGTAGDGGSAWVTCVRETDGLGVRLAASEPLIIAAPDAGTHMLAMQEAAGTNYLQMTYELDKSPWTADEAVTANAWNGPFIHYDTDEGFESIPDTSAVASHGVHQAVTTSTTGNYAFSCWLRAGTLTTARLAIVGTGNSAGDRTCTITGLDTTLSRDDRKGCVTTTPYAAGLSAITVSIYPGSADGDTGTVGAVDCQLEKNGHITSYIPNGWVGTSSRLVSSLSFPILPATLTLSDAAGSVASEQYAFRYDAETYWSSITVANTPASARGPFYFPDTTLKAYDGTNTPSEAITSVFNRLVWARASWNSTSSKLTVGEAGTTPTAGTYDGTMFGTSIAAAGMGIVSVAGAQDVAVGNVCLDVTDAGCDTQATMTPVTRIGWIGDSLSARTDISTRIPEGFFAREPVNGTNFAVSGAHFQSPASPTPCATQWVAYGNGTYDTLVVFCGVNDILTGTTGAALFAAEQAWIEEWAYRGLNVYWLDITPFKNYAGSTVGYVTERNNFNTAQASYCLSPAANVHCVTVSSLVWDPADHDALLAANTSDGLHFTQPAATIISTHMAASYP